MILYVARVDKMNKLKDSRPCINCYNVIRSLGIKKIVYSTDDSEYELSKTHDYKPENVSLGYSYIKHGFVPREKKKKKEKPTKNPFLGT